MKIPHEMIQKAKEAIGDRNADLIIQELGVTDYDARNRKCRCPFHNEDTPSFIYNQKNYAFHCFGACGKNYDLVDAYITNGMTYTEAVKKLFETADIPYAFPEHGVKTKRSYRYPKEEDINRDKSRVYEYLALRKISKKTADYLDIRQDENGNLVFNYYDTNDVLTMVKYRPSHSIDKKSGGAKNWCQKGADTANILYNMNRINETKPLLITSGELDCAAAIESGWLNAVSIPLGDQNLKWCEECYNWLEQFDEIYICADNDKSGAKFLSQVTRMLKASRCKTVNIPEYFIKEDGGKGKPIKDLNEYLYYYGPEKTLALIVNASDTPIESVLDLSDVEPIDYETMEGVRFGLESLDKEIMRVFLSTLTIISGRPGAGKSSLLAQLFCQAMDQGFNAWLFSGELPNGMNKNWMNYILAGPRNVEDKTSQYGNFYRRVSTYATVGINKYYRGKWNIYRDDYDNDINDLLSSMEDVVRKKAVRLLILDNFMCIDNAQTDDEIRSQTDTIKKLIKFAREFNVAVVLVCHPRKFDNGSPMDLYDIAGSSNIVNLAHRTIGLRRITDDERDKADKLSDRKKALLKYDVVITVIKDRMFGRQGIDCGVYYDNASRRFYTSHEEYDHKYAWDQRRYDAPLLSEKILEEEESDPF